MSGYPATTSSPSKRSADLVDVFSELGVDKVRLTGGEPLLRREVVDVVERLAANPDVRDLSMTTNGVLLAKQAESLRSAGLDGSA